MTTEEFLERRKSPDWKFNTVVPPSSFLHVNKIHPLKQRNVRDIVQAAKDDGNVRRIIIFGSATRYDCDVTSDLDVCIDWNYDCYDEDGVLQPFTKPLRRVIDQATKGHADVVDFAYLDGTLLEDAVERGVVVYVQDV